MCVDQYNNLYLSNSVIMSSTDKNSDWYDISDYAFDQANRRVGE